MRRAVAWMVLLGAVALAADNTPPEGFTALFNGKDLTGWGAGVGKPATEKQIAEWKVEDGIIKYTGKDGDLWTTKSFKDFVLMVEWRLPAPGDSGIYVRGSSKCQANIWVSELGSGEVYGYRTDGSLPEEIRKAATPSKEADKPVGEWNAFVITVKGDRMTVELNGEKVIDGLQMVKCPAEGPIALQNHGNPLEFRNIYIKELTDEPAK
ncbi:MAG TPA: DUF1080 domain-containing protein [Planctomycetota bacterium]|nr:DUF1080 domain-containing protein [Planctomycetota bacterium]HRR80232.1 DUF1080 domain-containing protein [Planctomycetota bacterium]HRT93120.1 DUF1080 domain-containing protein [Planctomycetota bacterium]